MKVVADTGPLLSAAHRKDPAHDLAGALVTALGRELLVLTPVIAEVDHLLRARLGSDVARRFLSALAKGQHTAVFMSPALLRRAEEIDARFAALDLGFVDASVMAYAERHELPILTFDFEHFRASMPETGHWRLVIEEHQYRQET